MSSEKLLKMLENLWDQLSQKLTKKQDKVVVYLLLIEVFVIVIIAETIRSNLGVAFGTISMALAILYIEIIKPWLQKPDVKIKFDREKYCRHEKKEKDPCYYCHFMVINSGRSQADDCEAVLEKVWWREKKKENPGWEERTDWIPVNLKWSAENKNTREARFKPIYPGERQYFCDIVRVDPKNNSNKKEKKVTCKYELGWEPISQDISLDSEKKYKIQVSIYSKNAIEATQKFKIYWCGKYEKEKEKMQECLKIEIINKKGKFNKCAK